MSKDLTRREMLARTAGFCAATLLAGKLPAMAYSAPFNVILHGLFVIDLIGPNSVQISSPNCSDLAPYPHQYRAGSWKKDYSAFQNMKGKFAPPSWGSAGQGETMHVPVLEAHMKKPHHEHAYFSIVLPKPAQIIGLRTFDESEIDYPSCCMETDKFPLVVALSYSDFPQNPLITGIPLTPGKNFHIFAEPEEPMDCNAAVAHGSEVMRRFWAMFDHAPVTDGPIPKNLSNCSKPPTASSGVSADEELSLSELKHGGRFIPEGIHLPMCATFVAP